MTPEGKASLLVKVQLNRNNCRVFRNNSGTAYDQNNRPVFFGLGNEGKKDKDSIRTPDHVGWHEVVVTPEMVGHKLAVFVGIDAKRLGFVRKVIYPVGTREYGQQKFFNMVSEAGGIAGFASCPEEVNEIINNFYKRFTS